MIDYTAARLNMVESQLRTNKITDPALLESFGTVPRELFVPENLRGMAYSDSNLEIGKGRCLLEPRVLGRLIQAANPQPGDMVLDVGCGSGYSTAILARLAATVVALESDKSLVDITNQTLTDLAIDNSIVVEGPLTEGYAKQGPYDVILINGSLAEIPPRLSEQLADGGRLVVVLRGGTNAARGGIGRGTLVQRIGKTISSRSLFDAATPFLPEFMQEPGFVF